MGCARNRRRMRERLLARRGPLAVLAAIQFVSSLGIAIMLPLIPLYALSLGASPLVLGLLTAAFAITNALGQFATGHLVDRFGPRRFIRAGIGVYVAQVADPARLAFVNGALSAAASAGTVIGPAVGGLVAAASDLHVPFAIVALTSGIAFAGSLRLRPVAPRPTEPGAGTEAPSYGRPVLVLLASNLFLLIGFGGFITTYAPFTTERLGWSIAEVGLIWSLFGLGDITLGPWLGHLADRTGRRRMAMAAVVPIAFFGLGVVLALPRPILYGLTILTGGGLTAFNGSWFALLTAAVPAARRGRVFGTVSAVSNAGTVIGAVAASAIWQALDLRGGLVLSSAACLAAGGALLLFPRPESERQVQPAVT